MTLAAIAIEHIAHRRAEGWTWGKIIAEVDDCLSFIGLTPRQYDEPKDIMHAYVAVIRELRREYMEAVP